MIKLSEHAEFSQCLVFVLHRTTTLSPTHVVVLGLIKPGFYQSTVQYHNSGMEYLKICDGVAANTLLQSGEKATRDTPPPPPLLSGTHRSMDTSHA